MRRLRTILFSTTVVLAIVLVASAEPTSQLHPSNYVNDFAGVLDSSTQARLNVLAKQLEEKAHAQMSVATVKSTDGQDVVSYAVDLYQKWGVGKKGTDRGVLILLAVQDRKYWTTVGYGLEPILPDGKVGGFGREAVPYLKSGDYSSAVSLIAMRVADVIAKDAGVTLDGVTRERSPSQAPGGGLSIGAIVVLVVIFLLIARAMSGGGRGGGGGFLSGLLWGVLLNSLGGRSSRGGWGGSSGGWGGGGFGGGGGGFGGFGGGSTGGGGAGGSW